MKKFFKENFIMILANAMVAIGLADAVVFLIGGQKLYDAVYAAYGIISSAPPVWMGIVAGIFYAGIGLTFALTEKRHGKKQES